MARHRQAPVRQDTRKSLRKSPGKKRGSSKPVDKAPSKSVAKSPVKSVKKSAVGQLRYRPDTKALKEVRKYQISTAELLPRAPFQRLVREITYQITNCPDIRYQSAAIQALQTAAEYYLVGVMEDSYLIAIHARRVTLLQRDMELALRIRGSK